MIWCKIYLLWEHQTQHETGFCLLRETHDVMILYRYLCVFNTLVEDRIHIKINKFVLHHYAIYDSLYLLINIFEKYLLK